MSDETFGDFSPWREAPLILTALSTSR